MLPGCAEQNEASGPRTAQGQPRGPQSKRGAVSLWLLLCVDLPLSTGPAGVSVSAGHESDKPFPGGLFERMGSVRRSSFFVEKIEGRGVNIMC